MEGFAKAEENLLKTHTILQLREGKSCTIFAMLDVTVGDCIKPIFYPNLSGKFYKHFHLC